MQFQVLCRAVPISARPMINRLSMLFANPPAAVSMVSAAALHTSLDVVLGSKRAKRYSYGRETLVAGWVRATEAETPDSRRSHPGVKDLPTCTFTWKGQ